MDEPGTDASRKEPERRLTRRRVLVGGFAAAVTGVAGGLAWWTSRKGLWMGRLSGNRGSAAGPRVFDFRVSIPGGPPVVAVATGASAHALATEAIRALGGMSAFIRRGDRVLIKPNVGWDRSPEMAANTNPDVVRALCEMCFAAGASRVVVSDNSCNEMHRCFDSSGIGAAARAAGAEVVFPREAYLKEIDFNGEVIRSWPVFPHFLEVDRLINLPIAKHHGSAGLTLGMKNWYGIVGGMRYRLHQKMHTCIADFATAIRPTLTVIDAFRILTKNGPQGGRIEDVRDARTLIASVDPVAADSIATTLFGKRGEEIEYLRITHARGLGEIDRARMELREVAAGAATG